MGVIRLQAGKRFCLLFAPQKVGEEVFYVLFAGLLTSL